MELDHLVMSAVTLQAGIAHVEATLGVGVSPGGAHDFMGTHNALLALGPTSYLEIIAVNPEAAAPQRPRWFDLDRFSGPPRLTNWICRSDDMAADRSRSPGDLGPVTEASRGTLNWRITIPGDGRLPCDGLCPGLISWKGSAHPAQMLPDRGVRMQMLDLCHPRAEELGEFLGDLLEIDKLRITQGADISMSAEFDTPNGRRRL